ncbi:hypothetical protein BH11ARM2_BH11ARM2_07650 [soil metagenome]
MEMRLQLVLLPVSDVDRAKTFYGETLGFRLDHDIAPNEEFRVVQLTPPGSACSIAFGKGMIQTPPGSVQALHLVVDDVRAARALLLDKGVDAGEVRDLGGVLYVSFDDPDGNGWLLQEITAHAQRPDAVEAGAA